MAVNDADDPIAALWQEVRPRQQEAARSLRSCLAQVAAQPADGEAWREARALTHRLAGTLGSFGQVAASDAALALEELIGGVEEPTPERIARARPLAEDIATALQA